ncbi:uncharacterized protein V2V93DRAFT_367934 [Kockiozyma suomiensis]|uniref:uncharacterized protein n=1 Tax=Kockiozyma suomiensis TaxID=1337062 RepID=UPI003343446A
MGSQAPRFTLIAFCYQATSTRRCCITAVRRALSQRKPFLKISVIGPVLTTGMARIFRPPKLVDDLVDDFGLVSRGNDDRLLHDEALQTRYFNKLQRKYLSACASAPGVEALRRTLESLSVSNNTSNLNSARVQATDTSFDGLNSRDAKDEAERRMALDQVVLGLRKLREAILASGPPTAFGKSVFLFTVRVTVPIGHYESYVPAMKCLLDVISQTQPLTKAERHEIGALYLLHLTHFSNNMSEAFEAMQKYGLADDLTLRQTLQAWWDRDYVLWRRRFVKEKDPARRKLMEYGDRTMALEALKRVGAAYFFMKREELEKITGWPWTRCVDELGCGWRHEQDSSLIVIRERKKKPVISVT